jgi:hypothetical protein
VPERFLNSRVAWKRWPGFFVLYHYKRSSAMLGLLSIFRGWVLGAGGGAGGPLIHGLLKKGGHTIGGFN